MPMNTAPSASEEALVSRLRAGDPAAFEQVMRRHNGRLFRVARSILSNDSDAEEALQEAYIRAFSGIAGFKGEASLATWLTRIAINEALMRLRRRRESAPIEEGLALPDSRPSPEQNAARRELRALVERALDSLPATFRAVFVLRAVEQMSVEETAAALGVREETVKTRFFRARRLLREYLGEELAAALGDTFPFAGERCDRLVAAVLRRLPLPLEIGDLP
ncbi:MAG: RNA polymerase sigma factor [Rhodospirillales bacterium]|nr:RNA polymerase sigma factor [Rhodospirillales bacterium]